MSVIDVAVGIVISPDKKVLITKRHANQDQGNLWEFPGGKVEVGETAEMALTRELFEEVGLSVISAKPFLVVKHAYPEKNVKLIVFEIDAYEGQAESREGQPVCWVPVFTLNTYTFPKANQVILSELQSKQC